MKFTTPKDAQSWLQRRFNSQHRTWFCDEGGWPLRVPLEDPTESQVQSHLAAVREWVQAWEQVSKATTQGEVLWVEKRWSRLGSQRLPRHWAFKDASAVAQQLQQGTRWERALVRKARLSLLWPTVPVAFWASQFAVLADYPDAEFERLLSFARWVLANQASGRYLRELPIEGLDTKWAQSYQAVVCVWLKELMQDVTSRDLWELAGLKRSPPRVRLRILCPELRAKLLGVCDLELPVEELATMRLDAKVLLVLENLETGLALPSLPGVVAIMGMGNAVTALARVPWLQHLPKLYWGDIDTYGFLILSRARQVLPGLSSVLMDEQTAKAHSALWVTEPSQAPDADLVHLTEAERAVYLALKAQAWGPQVRLEQERVRWDFALERLHNALSASHRK